MICQAWGNNIGSSSADFSYLAGKFNAVPFVDLDHSPWLWCGIFAFVVGFFFFIKAQIHKNTYMLNSHSLKCIINFVSLISRG